MEEQRARQEDEAKKAIESSATETTPVQETGKVLIPSHMKILRINLFLFKSVLLPYSCIEILRMSLIYKI